MIRHHACCTQVDGVLKKHAVLLKALYSRYRLKPLSGGLRPKVLKIDGWQQLLNDARLVDSQFTLHDGTLAFLWARSITVDEVKDFARHSRRVPNKHIDKRREGGDCAKPHSLGCMGAQPA